jgi:molecular chaperone HtpG
MDIYKIGKNVIENLTTGMYQDSKIIFREYIQNSADQIDKATKMKLFANEDLQIEIEINAEKRTIQIKDNATGIRASDIKLKLANIADSDKDRDEDKGFRGIGRLGGLAYRDILRFITSYKGEDVKTIMTWNAKLCRELINDKIVKDSAEEILIKVISFETHPCDIDEHFFIVELENIKKENNELLNVEEVCRYISSNAPVPYNNRFIFVSKIKEYIQEHNLTIDDYKIHVNGNDILKDYCTYLYENAPGLKKKYDEIYDIEFKQFKNQNGELIAWMWFGISAFDKQIPESTNEMRGLRLRKENIQIGNGDTLVPLFKEQRGNFYFIGEVHAVHKNLIPNARRDYFNENETRNEFEVELKYYFGNVLHKFYTDANKVKNMYKREAELVKKQIEYAEKKKRGFVGKEEIDSIANQVKQAKAENEKALKELASIKEKAKSNKAFERVIKVIEVKHTSTMDELGQPPVMPVVTDNGTKKTKERFITEDLHRLDSKQRKLVSKIYEVITKTLPEDLSKNLIQKIQDELNNYEKKSVTN